MSTAPRHPGRSRPPRAELPLRHILVPLDFSGQSRQAFECAVPLARAHGATISLLHVVQPAAAIGTLPDGNTFVPLNTEELLKQAGARLGEMALSLLPAEVRGKTLVREGDPAGEIAAVAAELRADLIALSTHGYSGLSGVLLGSTARAVVRQAPCPVLTVRRQPGASAIRVLSGERPKYPEQEPWRRMLVPVDFSFTSLRALLLAAPLARKSAAQCCLLHVIEPASYSAGMDGAMLAVPSATLGQTARNALARIQQRFLPAPITTTLRVAEGRAADVIVKTTAEQEADLIVLSTHGRRGLKRMLLGSTAEQVVAHAKCPVLVVRRFSRHVATPAGC